MCEKPEFSFKDKGVPAAYDDVLVPLLFGPWAEALLEHVQPREGWCAVDVATGTGIVAQRLVDRVGPHGSVTAVDISAEMLALARQRCRGSGTAVRFVESPASPLRLEGSAADVVYCQQGFQFCPDRRAAAAEMCRVLKPGGTVVVSTWCPVDQCAFFGTICDALIHCGESEVADMMAAPFNHMPAGELTDHFTSGGFVDVVTELHEADLVFDRGPEQAYETSFATPIGPRLRAFSGSKLAAYRDHMIAALAKMTANGVTSGRMASNVLVAQKPA